MEKSNTFMELEMVQWARTVAITGGAGKAHLMGHGRVYIPCIYWV
jgi:hypothetical protein